MEELFSRLEGLSARLNESSDSLNKTIVRVEEKLASLKLGVTAWVKEPLEVEIVTDDKGETDHEITTLLGYTKTQGTWHLVVMEECDRWSKDTDGPKCPWPQITPLQQAPRELRIKSLQQLPSLVAELEKKAMTALREVEKALAVADTV